MLTLYSSVCGLNLKVYNKIIILLQENPRSRSIKADIYWYHSNCMRNSGVGCIDTYTCTRCITFSTLVLSYAWRNPSTYSGICDTNLNI